VYSPTLSEEKPPSSNIVTFDVILPSSWSLAVTPSFKLKSLFLLTYVTSSTFIVGYFAFIIFSALSNSTLNNSYAG